jgi:hypothetical protein
VSDETKPDTEPTDETPAVPPMPTEPPTVGGDADTSAELERLRTQLAEVAPIVQAHKDAEEARKTEEQKLRDALEGAERERDEARRGLMLREVAEESGLASDVVALIQGATKDELLAAAQKIAEQSKGKGVGARPTPRVGGGVDAPPNDSDDIDPVKLARAIAKRVRF